MGYTITKIDNGYLLQKNYNTMYNNGFGYPSQTFYATLDELFAGIRTAESGNGVTVTITQGGQFNLGETANG